ncbi:MAG: Ig-like domain-containing protein [Thermoplasmata archaeon]
MAKRRSKEEQEKKRLLSEGYFECSSCGSLLKPGTRRCASCGTLTNATRKVIYAVVVAAVVVTASVLAYAYYPRGKQVVLPSVVMCEPTGYGASTTSQIRITFNKAMDRPSVESSFSIQPYVAGSFFWVGTTMRFTPAASLLEQTYYSVTVGQGARDLEGLHLDCVVFTWTFFTGVPPTERRGVGTGPEDFWVVYPSMHPSSGGTVVHPQWVLSALETGVVMILVHSTGCLPCIQQETICQAVETENPFVKYIDLVAGTDEPQSSEAFATYDPSGGIHYVPLTILLTKVELPTGGVGVGWHSWEGVIDKASLMSWLADAESHYEENS